MHPNIINNASTGKSYFMEIIIYYKKIVGERFVITISIAM